ncbi:MAG: hypothetical protein V3U82_02020 [Robiginitomaculum sp.]
MSNEQILNDIKYARDIAQDGKYAPLLGGRIGLMWGCLLVPTLLFVGLTYMGITGANGSTIGMAWMAFGIIGSILTFILSRSLADKAGINSVGNQVEQATWSASTMVLFGLAISVTYAVIFNDKPFWLYDIIMAIAFGTYALNYFVLAKISGEKALYIPTVISFGLMVFIMAFLGQPFVYIVGAIGVIFTVIIPALTHLKNEPKNA